MAAFNAPLPLAQLNLNVPLTSPVGSLALVGSSPQVAAIGSNQNRRGIIFINPGTVRITLVPSNQNAVAGQGVVVLPNAQVAFYSNPESNVQFNCGWNAIADTGSNNPLQILELV